MLNDLRYRLRALLKRDAVEGEMADELGFHIERESEKYVRQGLCREEAWRRARLAFGGPAGIEEECRDARGVSTVENAVQDVRYAARLMRKSPGFTFVAILTLAVGIGATTAMFSLISGILLRPLPYPDSERLVRVRQAFPEKGLQNWSLSPANIAAYRDHSTAFSVFAAYRNSIVTLTGAGSPELLIAASTTADFFKVLGIQPLLGAYFEAGQDTAGRNSVCVLSYSFWQRHGADRAIVGKSLTLANHSYRVVGVMPQGFAFPRSETEIWLPMALDPQATHPYGFVGIARLKPGTTAAQAQAETTAILWSRAQEDPAFGGNNEPPRPGSGLKTTVVPLKQAIVAQSQKTLLLLQCAVAFLLMIACANVANLLLSRAAGRSREIAVRYALGSTRRRVLKQLLVESVLLALAGAIPGIALAGAVVRLLTRAPITGVPRLSEVGVNGPVLLFAVVLALLTGLLFGLAPALRTARLGISNGLNEAQRGSSGTPGLWLTRGLVGVQLALSLVLLIGAALTLKSLQRLLDVDPGFRTANTLTMLLPASGRKYPTPQQTTQSFHDLVGQVRGLPGVTDAALISQLPLSGNDESDGYMVDGREQAVMGGAAQAHLRIVAPGYFRAMGMSLLSGRDFAETDAEKSTPVVVIDQVLARRHWPHGDAVGKQIRTTGDPPWLTVIGVVNDVKDLDLADSPKPHMYFAHAQAPSLEMSLVVRASGDAAALAPAVRTKIHELDPDLPLYGVRTMTDVLDRTLVSHKFTDFLLTAFAVVALLLAAVGIYGVMSVYVSSRSREFGIRMALGAQPGQLRRSVLGEGMLVTLCSAAAGLIGALAATHGLASLLYEVSPTDPVVFVTLPVVLATAALVACYIPARRAAATDPLITLRCE